EREMLLMLEEYCSTGNDRGVATARLVLGAAFVSLGKLEQALEFLLACKQFADRIADSGMRSNVLLWLGITHRLSGNYRDALVAAMEAAAIQENLGLHSQRARSLYCVAHTYMLLSDFKSALKYGQEGLRCARLVEARIFEANLLGVLGRIHICL